MTRLFSLLYVSETATSDASVVTSIADYSQINNARDGVTGLLLFDGKCFCQYVEGLEGTVQDLCRRLQQDTRHHDMRVLHQGPMDGSRLFPSWRMGFSYVADEQAIQRVLHAEQSRALEVFRAIDHGAGRRCGDDSR